MKPYIIVEGSSQSVEQFEKKVATALEQGYSLAGELVAKSDPSAGFKFYQPMMLADEEDDWDEEDDEEEDEEEEDEED